MTCMTEILNQIYEIIFDEKFDWFDLHKWIKMHSSIYILENMDINVGDYSYSLCGFCPASFRLDFDAFGGKNAGKGDKESIFTESANIAFSRIRHYLNMDTEYSDFGWISCIATVHYMKYVYKDTDNRILRELYRQDINLNKPKSNRKAVLVAEEINNYIK